MNKSLLLFSIIILLIYIIIHFIPKTGSCKDLKVYKKILLSDLHNKIKEGDLILFSSNRHNIITRTFGNDTFSHIGMVIKLNNKFYIYEIVNKDYLYPKMKYSDNISFSPFEERIANYNGNVYISSLIKTLSEDQINKLNNFVKNEYKYHSEWRMPFDLYSTSISTNRRFCSELIAEILKELNITNKPIKSKKIKIHTKIINLCNDIIYYKPVHIIPNNLLIKDIRNINNYTNYC